MRRKGFVYSLFSVLIVITLGSLIFLNSDNDSGDKMNINIDEKLRTDELFYFKEGAKQDFGRSVYISGRRGVIALIDGILDEGDYTYGDASENIEALISTGTYYNNSPLLMDNSTIED